MPVAPGGRSGDVNPVHMRLGLWGRLDGCRSAKDSPMNDVSEPTDYGVIQEGGGAAD